MEKTKTFYHILYSLYNAAMCLVEHLFRLVSRTLVSNCISHKSHFYQFISGQDRLLPSIREKMGDCRKEVVWIHAASLGEYAVAHPIIRQLRSEDRVLVLTLFSPSAYEVLKSRNCHQNGADFVFYLPWDTQENAKQFLDIVRPGKAIFIISEYWINYLRELDRRQIATYFVSSLIHQDSYLLKWYGRPILKAIPTSTKFMVLDEKSEQNLRKAGLNRVTVMGDPLFDNAIAIAQTPYSNDIIERFCATAEGGILIAGSISDSRDLEIVSSFADTHRNVKCIFVPHEICEEKLKSIKHRLDGRAELYSDCTPETDFSQCQVLIIDFVGDLARIYRYGRWAYVGGGFTPYLHSVIEPVVYGLPAAFGPYIKRKITPQQMIDVGIGKIVESAKDLSAWFDHCASDEQEMEKIRQKALSYANSHCGATKGMVQHINENPSV